MKSNKYGARILEVVSKAIETHGRMQINGNENIEPVQKKRKEQEGSQKAREDSKTKKDDEDFEDRTKTKQSMKKKDTRFRASAASEEQSLEIGGNFENGMMDMQDGFLPTSDETQWEVSHTSKHKASKTLPLSSNKRGGRDLAGTQQVGSFNDFAFKRIHRS